MRTRFWAGIVSGILAGIPFGLMMSMMTAPTPDGGSMPMMGMVAKVVRSESMAVGWTYHVFNSAVIGALFGWVLGRRVHDYGSGLGLGLVWGLVWWVLGGLILMPFFLGMPAFTPLAMSEMRRVAMGSLVGHLIYGVVLGVCFLLAWYPARHRGAFAT